MGAATSADIRSVQFPHSLIPSQSRISTAFGRQFSSEHGPAVGCHWLQLSSNFMGHFRCDNFGLTSQLLRSLGKVRGTTPNRCWEWGSDRVRKNNVNKAFLDESGPSQTSPVTVAGHVNLVVVTGKTVQATHFADLPIGEPIEVTAATSSVHVGATTRYRPL